METIPTTVTMDNWHAHQLDHSQLARIFIAVDPVDGVKRCEVYSDDGRGNGNLILSFDME